MGHFLELKKASECSGFMSFIRPIAGNFLDCFDMCQMVHFTGTALLALFGAHTDDLDSAKLQKRLDSFVEYSFVYKKEIDDRLARGVDISTLLGEDSDIVVATYKALHGDASDTKRKEAVARLIFGDNETAVSKAMKSSTITKLLGTLAYSLADADILSSKDEKNVGTVIGLLGGLDWNQKALEGLTRLLGDTKPKSWAEKFAELTTPLGTRKGVPNNDAGKFSGADRRRLLLQSKQGN